MSRWTAADLPDHSGRRALITGANSGIGLVEARELARVGADVILAVRNVEAGRVAADRIRAMGARGQVTVEQLDLASLESVRECASRLDGSLDLLVNNAGVMTPPKHRTTADGFELQFGTNHLGHFALTGLLLPRLLAAPAPRVTTVSSIAHRQGDAAVLDGNPAQGYSPARAYARSKLANVLFAMELHRRATAAGSALTSTAAHPGITATNLVASPDGLGSNQLMGRVGAVATRLLFPQADRGAEAVLYAAVVAEPGSYTGPALLRETRGPVGPAQLTALARDESLAADLWERSAELTGIRIDLG
ncbi:MAG: oxidoreductase [Dermatophilaceae bacterium]